MTSYEFGPRPFSPKQDDNDRHSVLSLVLLIAAAVVVAAVVLSVLFWAFGFLFSFAAFALRVALIVAIAAFVWKRVLRGRSHKSEY